MSSARETVLLAQDLYERMGAAAIGVADARSDALREAGDMEAAQFWRDVSRAMILIAVRPAATRRLPGEGSDNLAWALMQRIEGYRHLASEAEAVTDAISTAGPELSRIARGWRELVATLEPLAAALDALLPPKAFRGDVYELN